MKGQGGVIWIEQLNENHVTSKATVNWSLFKFPRFKRFTLKEITDKYRSLTIALTTLGAKQGHIKNLLDEGYKTEGVDDQQFWERVNGMRVPKKMRESYILHSAKERGELQRRIQNLMREGAQGVIFIEKFKLKENAGTKRRKPDISKAKSVGYIPKIALRDGLKITYDWYSKFYKNN